MKPVPLRSTRLVLDQPAERDVDLIALYCQDPAFEQYLTTPWPYERRDAEAFVGEHVPAGWESDRELTWAIRTTEGGPLLGVVGWRPERSDIGFWLGADQRGNGYMSEAVGIVADWLFARDVAVIRWECLAATPRRRPPRAPWDSASRARLRWTSSPATAPGRPDGTPN